MRLQDKVSVVTGGASGIGKASALKLAAEGSRLVVADLEEEGAAETARSIKESGGEAIAFGFNTAEEEAVKNLFQKTADTFGRLDCLFCSAGIAIRKKAADTDLESWDRVLAVNLRGLWLCAKYALKMMVPQGSGSLLFVSSSSGLVGVPDRAAYSASKAGVIGLMRSIVFDYSQYNIRCNCICPGVTVTPINAEYLANLPETDPKGWAAPMYHPPIPRLGTPEDMANAVLFLASDESVYVSGLEMAVDGGATCL